MQTFVLASFLLLTAIVIASAKWQNDALKLHNHYRKKHGSPALKLDGKLNKSAQKCANRIAKIGGLVHTNGINYGENLAYLGRPSRVSDSKAAKEAITMWYNEKKYYNYKNYRKLKRGQPTGHFTQVVWKASLKIGLAIARKGNAVYICAQYNPRGNTGNAGNAQKSYSKNVRKG